MLHAACSSRSCPAPAAALTTTQQTGEHLQRHVALVQVVACSEAGVVPPEDWQAGCLSMVLDSRVRLLTQLGCILLAAIPPGLVPAVRRPLLVFTCRMQPRWPFPVQ